MVDLFEKFGYCILPPGTLLYRGYPNTEIKESMFFGLSYDIGHCYNKAVQVWKITKEIKVLFLVTHLNSRAWAYSAIPDAFQICCPESYREEMDDVYIKNDNLELKELFINTLQKKYHVSGWLTSMEGKTPLEICLFNSNVINQCLILLDVSTDSEFYYKNSLKKTRLHPSKEFFVKSIAILNSQNSTYNYYRNYWNSVAREQSKDKQERMRLKHYYYTLRHKLKI